MVGQELQLLGATGPAEGESLSSLLDRCRDLVAAAEELQRQHATATRTVADLREMTATARREEEAAGKRMVAWREKWAGALEPLLLATATEPDVAVHVMEQLQEAQQQLKDAEDRARRIRGIDRDARVFTAESEALVLRLMPDQRELPVGQAVLELHGRLLRAKQDEARLTSLYEQAETKRMLQAEAEATITALKGQLVALCREAHVSESDELPEAELRWARDQALRQAVSEQEDMILRASPGKRLVDIEQGADAMDPDTIPGQLVEVESQLGRLDARRTELNQQIGEERKALRSMDGRDTAAACAEQGQRILAELRDQGQRYVRLRAAASLLRGEINRYRERNQESVLLRASALFARLTAGSFSRVASDFSDRDEPVLVGIRPSGELVGVEGMSDGTCDQLYLALRLASLERYLDTSEAMPLVVDDILIRFDDGRAGAALEALAQLSQRTQVIFFTHHERLVSLAEQLPSGAGQAAIHRLP